MKKVLVLVLVIVLALVLTFALSACGIIGNSNPSSGSSGGNDSANTSQSGDTTSGGNTGGNTGSNTGSGVGSVENEVDAAISQLNEYLKSLGLAEDQYGFSQYGVWNADLLPKCVPSEPAGVIEVDRTAYKDKKHEDIMADLGAGYGVGNLSFPDKNYEEHMVIFTCTPDALNEFLSGIETGGFSGGLYEIDPNNKSRYEWVGNGYYAHMISYADWDDENVINVEFTITPTKNPLPKSFQGTKLPDFGMVMYYEEFGGVGWENDESEDDFWDIYNDKGDLPAEHWYVWFSYDFVTPDDAKGYVQSLVSQGWELIYDDETTTWDGESPYYYAQLKKGEIFAAVDAPYDGRNNIAVRFGTVAELLYY